MVIIGGQVIIIVIPDIIIVHGVGDILTDTIAGDILIIMVMAIMEVTGMDIIMVTGMVITMDYMQEGITIMTTTTIRMMV